MFCCPLCIGDKELTRHIFPIYSVGLGICSYCKSVDQHLIDPKKLKEYFELVVGIYSRDNSGASLVSLLRDDWNMFSHPEMDEARSKMLLSEILDDGEVVRQKFIPSELCKSDRLDIWGKLKDELKHENRFFPTTEVDEGRLKDLLSFLQIESHQVDTIFYRARIQRNNLTILTGDMGAPPKLLASQGRANPAGIPYLYIASTPQTAISEIRPHTGELASVVTVAMPAGLKFVDLRCPRTTVSPFMLADEVAVGLLRGDIDFLVGLGNELSIPVLPHVAAIDYIPSQYLCEFIKRQGFDGVIYQSSVGDGFNLAMFYPNCVTLVATETYRVSQVSVSVELNC